METLVKELLPLATKIAREFDNISGLPHAKIEMAAQQALARAARLFDPTKGDFSAYAAITTLRERVESMGFPGVDTLGLLKSGCCVSLPVSSAPS